MLSLLHLSLQQRYEQIARLIDDLHKDAGGLNVAVEDLKVGDQRVCREPSCLKPVTPGSNLASFAGYMKRSVPDGQCSLTKIHLFASGPSFRTKSQLSSRLCKALYTKPNLLRN